MSGYTDLTANFENNRNCLRRIARHDEQEFSKDSIVNVMEKFVKTVNVMDETILVPCRLMDRQVGDSTDMIPAPEKTSSHHHQQHHHHHHHTSNVNGSRRKNRSKNVRDNLNSADLFNLYTMLNSLKNDLLWTRNDDDEGNEDDDELNNSLLSTTLVDPETRLSNETATTPTNDQPQQQLTKSTNTNNNNNTISRSISTRSESSTSSSIKGHIRRPSTASMASSNSASNLSDSESEISNENDSGIESEGICGGSSTTSSSSNSSSTNVDKATELARQCRTHLNGLYRCLEQMTEAANYLTARYQSDIGPV